MKRTLLVVAVIILVLGGYVGQTLPKPSSDEETLKTLEIEWAKHSNGTDADIAFQNGVVAPMSTSVDVFGNIRDQSPADLQKAITDAKTANPDAKNTFEIKDIKVRVYGDRQWSHT
jgi:hypothetical protein